MVLFWVRVRKLGEVKRFEVSFFFNLIIFIVLGERKYSKERDVFEVVIF